MSLIRLWSARCLNGDCGVNVVDVLPGQSRDVGVRAMKQLLSQEDALTGGASNGTMDGSGAEGELGEGELEEIRGRTSVFLQGSER